MPAPPQIEGRYVLQSVDGRQMPVLLFFPGQRYYIWYDSLTLSAGSFRDAFLYRDSLSDGTIRENGGSSSYSYLAAVDTVFFQFQLTRVDTAFVTAAALRMVVNDKTKRFCVTGRCDYVYQRAP
ncbi:MAG: hypothetical protein U0163_10125 [Gemmatimonadaceae bacterium]